MVNHYNVSQKSEPTHFYHNSNKCWSKSTKIGKHIRLPKLIKITDNKNVFVVFTYHRDPKVSRDFRRWLCLFLVLVRPTETYLVTFGQYTDI